MALRPVRELSDEIEVNRNQGYIIYLVLQIDHGWLKKKIHIQKYPGKCIGGPYIKKKPVGVVL